MTKKPESHYWQNGDLILNIYLQPNAIKDEYAGEFNGCIKLKIKAPPVDGKANKELLSFLSELFAVPKNSVQLLQGETSRYKKIRIHNPKKLPAWTGKDTKPCIASQTAHD